MGLVGQTFIPLAGQIMGVFKNTRKVFLLALFIDDFVLVNNNLALSTPSQLPDHAQQII